MKIELYDGKYTFIKDENGQRALRHGLPWRDLLGDGFVLAMAQRIEELEDEHLALYKAIAEFGIGGCKIDLRSCIRAYGETCRQEGHADGKSSDVTPEKPEFPDGWYFVKMKQVLKADRKHPDYIEDWVERINGEWELGGYKLNCDFDSVIRREKIDV